MKSLLRFTSRCLIIRKNLLSLSSYRFTDNKKPEQTGFSSKIDEKQMNQNQTNDKTSTMDHAKNMYTTAKEGIKHINTSIDELLITDHKDIMAFLDEFENTNQEVEAFKWLRQFIWELARHSIAEELILYPMFKEKIPKGDSYWTKSLDDHRKVKVLLREIEVSKELTKIRPKMKEVRDSLSKHIKFEEEEVIPLIRNNFTEQERVSCGNTFLRRKLIVPTRAHPHVPDSIPTIESLIGLFIAPVDKFKDIFYAQFPDQATVNKIKQKNV
jgi:hemerythrin superfamily protein